MQRRKAKTRKNYGQGDLFNFHGAFTEKADAVKKERSIPGAFIKTLWFRSGPRYSVLTRNPHGRTVARVKGHIMELGTYAKGAFHRLTGKIKSLSKRNENRDTTLFHEALRSLYPGKSVKQLTTAQFSEVVKKAQELKTATKNPVIKVPGGWRARSRTGRMSRVFPERRDAEDAAQSLNPRKHRHARKNARRRNYADSTELYSKFHGKGPARVTDTGLPIADYGDHHELAQLGKLVSLTIGDKDADPPWVKKIEWGSREAPDLAAEPGGRQLYIIGGSQNLEESIEKLPIRADKDLLDLGFAYQVEYFTQKKFDNFQPVQYWHDLGEETGERPRVVYDRRKKRIHLVGGAYVVKPEGIVN